MNRTDFYKEFVDFWNERCENKNDKLNQAKSKELCTAVFDYLFCCIKEHDRVYIKGLGSFRKKQTAEHRVGNFHGESPIIVPAGEKIVFEPYAESEDE